MPTNEVRAYVKAGLNGQKQYPRKYPVSAIKITDEESFVKSAEAVLFDVYGEKKIKAERPYKVGQADGYWMMTGYLWAEKGGVFYIMINAKTGQVIYLTHGK
ncbi:NTF2 fold immunity protein [Mucilaginibacter sp.]|uniref:NTF2 fold immunity protein n=1 Tax=Mucilaginibacter sp. TaxID=1882438 RepID=UPI003267EA81